jgi:hypothetical protein
MCLRSRRLESGSVVTGRGNPVDGERNPERGGSMSSKRRRKKKARRKNGANHGSRPQS